VVECLDVDLQCKKEYEEKGMRDQAQRSGTEELLSNNLTGKVG
jgi:hypothetical protein